MNSKIVEMKKFAYKQAWLEDSISVIRHCEKKGDPTTGYLIVNSAITIIATPTPELSMLYFGSDVICEITPKEYKQILSKKRKLPKGWVLKEVLFDGIFVFDNLTDLIVSLKEWPYRVEVDRTISGILGFKCKSGRKWQMKLANLKNSDYDILEDEYLFIDNINTKPDYIKKN